MPCKTKASPEEMLDPVSYTHLDVYKRQVQRMTALARYSSWSSVVMPTHLPSSTMMSMTCLLYTSHAIMISLLCHLQFLLNNSAELLELLIAIT